MSSGHGGAARRAEDLQDRERRSSAWRKEVRKVSAAYAVDNINNSWRRRSLTKTYDTRELAGSMPGTGKNRARSTSKTSQTQCKKTRAPSETNQTQSRKPEVQGTKRDPKRDPTKLYRTYGVLEQSFENKQNVGIKQSNPNKLSASNKQNTSKAGSVTSASRSRKYITRKPAKSSTCAMPLLHHRGSDKTLTKEMLEPTDVSTGELEANLTHLQPPAPHLYYEDQQQQALQNQTEEGGQGETYPSSSRWREPRVQVFYHVPEKDVAQAEEQLKRCRQPEADLSDVAALSDLDLQLLVLALLSRDLPMETAVMSACLSGPNSLALSALADMADLLSLLDPVLSGLGDILTPLGSQGELRGSKADGEGEDTEEGSGGDTGIAGTIKAKVNDLLKAAGERLEVSQRTAGAVHSLLRSLECGLLDDATISKGLCSCTTGLSCIENQTTENLQTVRSQLKSSLGQLVERLEEGHAPSSMTSSDWARLTNEVIHQVMQPASSQAEEEEEDEADIHQSPSHCSNDDDNNEEEAEEEKDLTDYDEMRSFEYFDPEPDAPANGASSETPRRDASRSRRRRKEAGRASARSRARSESGSRFTSKSPPPSDLKSNACSPTAPQVGDGAAKSPTRAVKSGSWSPVAHASASSATSSATSLSMSSSSSPSSSSSSSSCCSAASRASGDSSPAHAHSRTSSHRDPEESRSLTHRSRSSVDSKVGEK
ncbi:hypothetical protein EGW08_018122 [Elysia chlorotica]|uniref:Uncharacterized protein n=1 Tax=Elysia chlorotica TaxID=188477 RepID=A0A433SXR6_ELYCH|nr:hypothetical protein EGW08_018122 [Elysia chlorotica]